MMAKVNPPRRLRAARTATRNGLSSVLRLARPLAYEAQTMVQLAIDRPSALATPLYPTDMR